MSSPVWASQSVPGTPPIVVAIRDVEEQVVLHDFSDEVEFDSRSRDSLLRLPRCVRLEHDRAVGEVLGAEVHGWVADWVLSELEAANVGFG